MWSKILTRAKQTFGNETAWKMEDIADVFTFARASRIIILGGDILKPDLSYTLDNWYYNPSKTLSQLANVEASYLAATEYINNYSARNGKDFYVVVVLKK